MAYIEADDEYFELVKKHNSALISMAGKSEFPQTCRAMLVFTIKMNSLKTAMFDMVDSNNPYAFKLLFRCFCEHYLRFTYIFIRFLSEKTDDAGEDYYSFCGAVEAMDYVAAIKSAEALLGNELVGDIRNALTQLYPQTESMSMRQIETESAKFKYKAILRFLNETAPSLIDKERPFLAQIIPAYALLSSFVHGGPYTEMEMLTYSRPEALENCEEDAGLVFVMTASAFAFSAMAMSREFPSCSGIATEVLDCIKRFLAQ